MPRERRSSPCQAERQCAPAQGHAATTRRLSSPAAALPTPRVRSCLFLRRRRLSFFFSPSTWGYDAVSLGPRVMPRPLAWLMLMRRRRGGGQGRGASGQGSASQMSPGWKPGEGVLGSKSLRQAPGDGCAVGGTGSLFPPILGPIGVRPRSSLLGRRGAAAGSPQPGGRWDSRGL